MKLDIDAISTPNIWRLSDSAPVLEIYANGLISTSDNQVVLPGRPDQQDIYRRVVCSVTSGVLLIPTITDIDSTEDAMIDQTVTYSAYIRVSGREPIPFLLGFPIPPITVEGATSYSWATLRNFAEGRTVGRAVGNRATSEQWVLDAIAAALQSAGIQARGKVALVDGAATVLTIHVAANSLILLTGQDSNVIGTLNVASRTPGVSFVINSSNGADNGDVAWAIIAP